MDELIDKFLAAFGVKLILLDYNHSRLRGALLDDFLHALGVVRPGLRRFAATGHGPIVNKSLCLNIANCLTYLTAAILDGLSSDVNPETMLHGYLSSLEADVVDGLNFIRESKRICSLVEETYGYARKARLADNLLMTQSTSLAHEFNALWRNSRISLKPSQAVLIDITPSERLPQLKISQEKTRLHLEKICTKYIACDFDLACVFVCHIMPLIWTLQAEVANEDWQVFSEAVLSHLRCRSFPANIQPVACLVRESDRLIAGGSGRGPGMPRRILQKHESEAGCRDAMIDTLDDSVAHLFGGFGYLFLFTCLTF